MEIIGEKINGTRKAVAAAIAERNAVAITDLAASQAAAGASWLDINAGTRPDQEPADLLWLVETVQAAVDTPLCLDSAILDPTDRELMATLKATELVLGLDRRGLNYTRAFRAGLFA